MAAVQGEVKGKFSLFGADITLSGTGELGAAGVVQSFPVKQGKWSLAERLHCLQVWDLKLKSITDGKV